MSYTPYPANREINIDGGGRTRVSGLTTLFDGKTLNFDDTLTWENVGTGTPNYVDNKVNLSVTTGQYLIRRSRQYLPYFSGKSQIIETTFDGFDTVAGVTERVGYFSSSTAAPYDTSFDGFFIENAAGVISFKAYRSGTETMSIPFTSWDNYQQLQSYDWSKFTVLVFDYLWLGGTEVRLWLKVGEGYVLAHTAKWASLSSNTFIKSPNQNIRYEIRSTTGTSSLRCICSAVSTEGDVSYSGKSQSIFTSSAITTNTVGTIYAIKSLKKLATSRDLGLVITSIGVANTSASDFGMVMLIANPTLSGAITYTDRQGFSEGSPTNQTITAGTGTVIFTEPVGSAGSASGLNSNFRASLGMSIADVSDEYVLAYMPTSVNQSVFGNINFKVV